MKTITILILVVLIVLFLAWKSKIETLNIPDDVIALNDHQTWTDILNAWEPSPGGGAYTFKK